MGALSIDVGFSSVKFAYSTPEGILRVGKIVSAIAKFPSNEFNNSDCIEYGGNYYLVGELAVKSPTESLIQLNTYEDLRDIYPVIIKYITESLSASNITYDKLVVGLSIAHLSKAEDLIDWISRECNMDKGTIFIYPQGVSSKYTIYKHGMNLDNESNQGQFKNYIGVDIGFNTVDVYNVINNQCSISSTYGFKDSGIVYICNQVSEELRKGGINLGIQDLKEYIETGSFQYRGKKIEIRNLVDKLMVPYTINLIRAIEGKSKSAIDKSDRIILTGGGANLISRIMGSDEFRSELEKLYGSDFIIIPRRPELYNVIGYKIAVDDMN